MEIVKNFTQSKILKNLFVILVGTVLLAISSKIKIPFYPVPMTMQTFVVLVIGIGFGWKIGIATVALYLFEGLIGLPVFSGTPEKGVGFIYFTGPTMGYLIGFLVTIFFAGRFNYQDNLIFVETWPDIFPILISINSLSLYAFCLFRLIFKSLIIT